MLELAYEYAELSTCQKRQVGCVVVKEQRIISIGFNHGIEESCSCSFDSKNPHVLHAEEMALQGSSKKFQGATLYVSYPPCMKCADIIVRQGIKHVVMAEPIKHVCSILFLQERGVQTSVSRKPVSRIVE